MTQRNSHGNRIQDIPQTELFGHPRGLGALFFVEFWERFSYYDVCALLIFHMYFTVADNGLGIDKTAATSIMPVYGSLIYMTSTSGGWIADRITDTRGATLLGAVFITIEHICLSLPFALIGLFTSMFSIIIGSGLMKPNISNIVGRLYPENDRCMDAGFVISYVSVGMGALLSPTILQHFVNVKNFHGGFLIAVVGMALGLVWYVLFNRKNLDSVDMRPINPLTPAEEKKYGLIIGSVVLAIVLVIVIGALTSSLSFNLVSNTVLILGIALPVIYFTLIIGSKDVIDTERFRVKAFIPLFILGMVFWAIQEQGSNVLSIHGIEHSDMKLNLFGRKTSFGEAIFQSISPLFILLLAPIISPLWQKLGAKQPSLPVRSTIGTFLAGASYILIGIVGYASSLSNFSVNWVILSYIICVIGELCLSPTGNSAIVKLVPKTFSAQMMSIWYLINASTQAINGTLVRLIEPLGQTNYFIFLGVVMIIVTTVVLAFSPLVIKAMRSIR